MENARDLLTNIRSYARKTACPGLKDHKIARFLEEDPRLRKTIELAHSQLQGLRQSQPELLEMNEIEQLDFLQKNLVNFYKEDARNPYLPLAAIGPWIVTLSGAVIHDSGGYGMLGHGHAPETVLEAMHDHHVMANVMTANTQQKELIDLLLKEIGHSRDSKQWPSLTHFLFMNSGSEAMTVGLRLSDVNAANHIQQNPRISKDKIKFIALEGSFHGRTDRTSQVSASCIRKYKDVLESYKSRDNLILIPPNDSEVLAQAFAQTEKEGGFVEALVMEPVMGEGNPGLAIQPEFYDHARRITKEHGAMLLVDSVQAGLRTHGCLSIIDYPGFQESLPPDMEAFSKAINAGQYPLSLLAMTEEAAELYKPGIYGNTMTGNPKAMAIATAVLKSITPALRKNIRDRGKEAVEKFQALAQEFPQSIESVQGTGLIVSIAMNPTKHEVVGPEGLELKLRQKGIGVIHGGTNSLRFTPVFDISSAEIDLITHCLREVLQETT